MVCQRNKAEVNNNKILLSKKRGDKMIKLLVEAPGII